MSNRNVLFSVVLLIVGLMTIVYGGVQMVLDHRVAETLNGQGIGEDWASRVWMLGGGFLSVAGAALLTRGSAHGSSSN